jgi:hypothetical protein
MSDFQQFSWWRGDFGVDSPHLHFAPFPHADGMLDGIKTSVAICERHNYQFALLFEALGAPLNL